MKTSSIYLFFTLLFLGSLMHLKAQKSADFYAIIGQVSKENIKKDVRVLANFGTRHTLSDTLSETRGIGAARRWIFDQFQSISENCNGCLEVFYQRNFHEANGQRLVKPVWINNVVAIQRGTQFPNRFVIMSGDIDSRVSDPNDYTSDSPGANDNASGMAGTLEAARVLSQYQFQNSIVYTGLSGEEQGLYGGAGLAKWAKKKRMGDHRHPQQ